MTVGTYTSRNAPHSRRSSVPLRYAPFESRVTAGILDVLVLSIIASLLVTAGSLVVLISSDFEKVDPSTMSINIFWGCVIGIVPAALLYFFVGLCWRGQTVGKAVMQIMVIRSDGRPLGVFGAMSRVIGQLVYVLFALGGVLAAFRASRFDNAGGHRHGHRFSLHRDWLPARRVRFPPAHTPRPHRRHNRGPGYLARDGICAHALQAG